MQTQTRNSGVAEVGGDWLKNMNMQERKDPVKFEFGDGVVLCGVLQNVERVQVRDPRTNVLKPATRYTMQELESSEPVFFFGTYQIDTKLRAADVGHVVSIRCEGEDKTVARNGNAMKVFKIAVSDKCAPGYAANGTPVTDADVGF